MKLANPVPGTIAAKGKPFEEGQFRVTSTMAEHDASGRGNGTDFGNGGCGAPVYAMDGGLVYRKYIQNTPGLLGHGARIIRIRHADGSNTGYAHLASFAPGIEVGKTVTRGQQIGTLGKSGADACHLHAHFETARGKRKECFGLLAQNQEETLTTVTVTLFPEPRTCRIAAGMTVQGFAPTESTPRKTTLWPTGSAMHADGAAFIEQVPLSAPHGTFYRIIDGHYIGLFVPISQVTLVPAPAAPDPCAAIRGELVLANDEIAKVPVVPDTAP